MTQDYDHGVGTSPEDQVFPTREGALNAAAGFIGRVLKKGTTRVNRDPEERTVVHKGKNRFGLPATVTIREDSENPSTVIPDVEISYDVTSKELRPTGRIVKTRVHFGARGKKK